MTFNDDLEIIALNGLTGECLTTADDWTQRLKETSSERIEEIVEKNQTFFNKLEFFAAQAIDNGDWESFFDFIDEFRGFKPRPRLQRVSLQEFLEKHSCTTQTATTEVVDAAVELDTPSSVPNSHNSTEL
jgi:hypothetical protein